MPAEKFIDRIRIKNFKGFAEETFTFHERFTVVIGDNGTGKTALLDAIAVAAGTYFIGIDGIPPRVIGNDEVRRREISRSQIELQFPVEIEAYRTTNGLEQHWKREKRSLEGKTLYAAARYIADLASRQQEMVRANEQSVTLPVIAYHGTGRLWAEHNEAGVKKPEKIDWMVRGPRTDAYKLALSTKSSSKLFLSWYKTLDYEYSKVETPEDAIQIQAFSAALKSMVADWEEIYFSPREEDLVGYLTKGDDEKVWLPYRMLSDGYRNMIGLVADIAFRCIKLNPHLGLDAVKGSPGIVMIDELDLHLHPKWQRTIVRDLKNTFQNIQFIVTTHSPFIVQSLQAEELINIDGVVPAADPEDRSLEENVLMMGVTSDRSDAFFSKIEDASKYLQLLQQTSPGDKDALMRVSEELTRMARIYSDDPAFIAEMEFEKIAKLGI